MWEVVRILAFPSWKPHRNQSRRALCTSIPSRFMVIGLELGCNWNGRLYLLHHGTCSEIWRKGLCRQKRESNRLSGFTFFLFTYEFQTAVDTLWRGLELLCYCLIFIGFPILDAIVKPHLICFHFLVPNLKFAFTVYNHSSYYFSINCSTMHRSLSISNHSSRCCSVTWLSWFFFLSKKIKNKK